LRTFKRTLIGHTGFVGTSLRAQAEFDANFSRANIKQASGTDSDLLICSAAPAQKWLANKNPNEDLENLRVLVASLEAVSAETAVLISTVDVFSDPRGVNEADTPSALSSNAYGQNRLWLEREFKGLYPNALIVRLPGLVGPGLRKNALFDLRHNNEIHKLNGASIFQFYPMENLWRDIQFCLAKELPLVHLTSHPLPLGVVAKEVFGIELHTAESPVSYDFQTMHSAFWGKTENYQYDLSESLAAIRRYAQS